MTKIDSRVDKLNCGFQIQKFHFFLLKITDFKTYLAAFEPKNELRPSGHIFVTSIQNDNFKFLKLKIIL